MADISSVTLPKGGGTYNLKDNAAQRNIVKGSLSLSTSWSGSGPYTQTVAISGGTSASKIDIQPDATVINQLVSDGVTALYIYNNNGTFTAYAVGAAPTAAMTVQYTRTEVTS